MITLALIGLGKWGGRYLKTASHIPDCRIRYVCAPSLARHRGRFGSYKEVEKYTDLVRFKDIDGVIIATPASSHFRIAKFFVERGYNILIEKPITTRYRDAVLLQKIHKKHGGIVMVGHLFLYHGAFLKMKELLKEIGSVVYLQSEGFDWGPFRPDISALWDWAPHDMSMLVSLMGVLPSKVRAWSVRSKMSGRQTDDMINIQLLFAPSISAFVRVGWLSPIKRRELVVVGTKGSLVFDDTKEKKLAFFEGLQLERVSYLTYEETLPLERQLGVFASCIRKKTQPEANLAHGVDTIKIIEAIEKSLTHDGKTVNIDLAPRP